MSEIINSRSYWENRFSTDWEDAHGREQTAFFAQVAVSAFPNWLASTIRSNELTILDWGCAEGDGVPILARGLRAKVSGMDFSASAIENARHAYPDHDFHCFDIMKSRKKLEQYDIVFSSNTLEHFHKPWKVLDRLKTMARKHIVLLLPYQEFIRHPEHFYTFDLCNIPVEIRGFSITCLRIIDCGRIADNHWPFKQVLLVYSRSGEAAREGVSFFDAFGYASVMPNEYSVGDVRNMFEAQHSAEISAANSITHPEEPQDGNLTVANDHADIHHETTVTEEIGTQSDDLQVPIVAEPQSEGDEAQLSSAEVKDLVVLDALNDESADFGFETILQDSKLEDRANAETTDLPEHQRIVASPVIDDAKTTAKRVQKRVSKVTSRKSSKTSSKKASRKTKHK